MGIIMRKWIGKTAVAGCLAGICLSLSGCAAFDAVKDAMDSMGIQWEEERSEAEREREDLPRQESRPEASGQENAQEGEESSGESSFPEEDPATGENDADKPPQEEFSFTREESGHFAYDSLNEEEKVWYRNINRILGRMQEKQELSESGIEAGMDENHIDKIFQCVLNDHPEYFYVEGYTYTKFTRGSKLVKIEFSGTYSMELEAAKERHGQIQEAARELLAGISEDAGEYDKVKYVYETVIRSTGYDLNAPDNQNIYSVFVNRSSVCQGYAKAVQYLLNSLGMECTMVMGTVDTGEGHAWNLVKVDGSYYFVDATWGDASYQMEENEELGDGRTLPEINYDYLCVTTEQLLRTHTLGGVVPMPQCVSMEANYYVREGAYFTTYDADQVSRVFASAGESGRSDVTLKCDDLTTYRELNRILIEEQGIFEYLDSPDGVIAFAQNEKQLSMTFWMTNE